MCFQFGDKSLDLSQYQVMGILNVTPDSFSDGGKFTDLDKALYQAEQMVKDGASIIDVGGESTRPGAELVAEQQELDRVLPVIEALTSKFNVVVSVDTSTSVVMLESAKVGASLINDVRALQRPGALEAAAKSGLPVCLMHMQGQPKTMQQNPEYDDVIENVVEFLRARKQVCMSAGISEDKILYDPGFGFGKSLDHNYQLLSNLRALKELDGPILVGLSRKSMIGNLLNREVSQRLPGSLAGALIAAENGARIFRVHDVAETVDVLNVLTKTQESSRG